jgi:hypothetical protein
MSRDPAKRRASKQRYNQSAKGQATVQRAADKVAAVNAIAAEKKAAFAQTAREAAVTAFVKLKREQTHAQRVAQHFSKEELAAAADKVPFCPSYFSAGTLVTSASEADPGFMTEVVETGSIKGQEAVNQISHVISARAGQRAGCVPGAKAAGPSSSCSSSQRTRARPSRAWPSSRCWASYCWPPLWASCSVLASARCARRSACATWASKWTPSRWHLACPPTSLPRLSSC